MDLTQSQFERILRHEISQLEESLKITNRQATNLRHELAVKKNALAIYISKYAVGNIINVSGREHKIVSIHMDSIDKPRFRCVKKVKNGWSREQVYVSQNEVDKPIFKMQSVNHERGV